MLVSAVNVSEGRDPRLVAAIGAAAGHALLDVHTDPDHHRTVLTVAGEEAARAVAREAVARLDLSGHHGAHPRIGVVDVVPFVPVAGTDLAEAVTAREAFLGWAATELGVPGFRYGPERALPAIRRRAWRDLGPDTGPSRPHPTAGAVAVGARLPLVAYNVWLARPDLALARAVAAELRGPHVRALGLAVGAHVQVSINLIAPHEVGPGAVYDRVAARAPVSRAELVGLLPRAVLAGTDPDRWEQLDLSPGRTVEARLAAQGWATT